MKLVYRGPHDAVEVPLPNGGQLVVERDGEAEFPPSLAESLLEQESNWQPAGSGKKGGK